ncbi:MAG: DNA alkylation repair protein [Bacteroidia bacterium]|nr:DNA alkylation repair protein [Bacteroidia bacterium]
MEPLKEMFNRTFYERFAAEFNKTLPTFDKSGFVKEVTKNLDELSLNQRLRRTTETLKSFLPADYKKAIGIMKRVIPDMHGGYTNLVFPDFVGQYGHDDFHTSMDALKYFTQFGSSEFAIREFLKRDFDKTIKQMKEWSKDKNHHVRRLASEGSRPRLPWSFKLDRVIQDPSLTISILQTLNKDPELYVRKSVANHLNDISKEHPEFMLESIRNWDKSNQYTAWIIKHASRTLIKKGHSGSLSVFDFEKDAKVIIEKFKLNKNKLKLGDTLVFEFDLVSAKKKDQKLVVDYIIHYRKKLGELSPKVFKLKELKLGAGERLKIEKKQRFQDFTTRKHFKGEHLLEIQVNGKKLHQEKFHIHI